MKKKNYIFGILFALVGLAIAIGPRTFIHVCGSDGEMVMRCHYTAQAALGIGIETAIFGVLAVFEKSRGARIATSISVLLSGIFTILVPTVLIGVCDSVHMHCNAVTKPALSLLGAALVILAVVYIILLSREGTEEHE